LFLVNMTEPKFIHLHLHSDFSMIDGIAKVGALVNEVSKLQMPAFAITDFTNLCGLVKFYGSAMGKGIKPIIGADLAVKNSQLSDEVYRLTLLAANNEGYQNLTLLISKAYQRGYIGDLPVVDQEWLIMHSNGLIILAGRESDIGIGIIRDNQAIIDDAINFYQETFNQHFYFELVRTNRLNEELFIHSAYR
ncbi:DNA polymerase III, alpha subunit, partial [Gilliamella apis SCGC AB-598-P17]